MKTKLAIFLMCAITSPVWAAHNFPGNILCHGILGKRGSVSVLQVEIQTNPRAWLNSAFVRINKREVGRFTITPNQPEVSTVDFIEHTYIAQYNASNFNVSMQVGDSAGVNLLGPAHAQITLPDQSIDTDLRCERIK